MIRELAAHHCARCDHGVAAQGGRLPHQFREGRDAHVPAAQAVGRLTMVVANAGFGTGGPIHLTSLADSVAATFSAMSAMFAIYNRDHGDGKGQEIDVSLYEPLFRLVESQVIGFDQLGIVKQRQGNRLGFSLLSRSRAASRPGQPDVPDIGCVPWPVRHRPSISSVA